MPDTIKKVLKEQADMAVKRKKPKPKFMKLELVDNAGDLWKAMSNWVFVAIAILGVLTVFVDGLQSVMDPVTYGKVSAVLAALGVALRSIKQPTVSSK